MTKLRNPLRLSDRADFSLEESTPLLASTSSQIDQHCRLTLIFFELDLALLSSFVTFGVLENHQYHQSFFEVFAQLRFF